MWSPLPSTKFYLELSHRHSPMVYFKTRQFGYDDGDDDDGNGWHLSPRQVLIALTFIKSFCP